jgi:hypothetical protein
MGQAGTIGYQVDTGKITCNGETEHVFDEMPGEQPPAAEPETSVETLDLQNPSNVPEAEMTAEETAALDKAMQEPPRPRDFGSQVVEAVDEVGSDPEPSGTQETAVCGMPGMLGGLIEALTAPLPGGGIALDALSPRVGLGEFVVLPNGDAVCGVRVHELWVSAMQAEAENRVPPITLAEYLQEIMDTGLVEWHSAVPGVR